ncbi:MAG: flagellar hook protein FlgE [Alphaproteobacteria bacterium]
MSVFGSLFTAASGLQAQSQSMGMISNNIANVSTVGYKRTDAAFSSLVTNETRSVLYSPGSVRVTQNARIDQQGILQQSSSATDIGMSGDGFFVVKRDPTDPDAETLYTRAGSFSEDAEGILRNTAGFYLFGWPLDQNGALPANSANISSLVPIDFGTIGNAVNPTTEASMSLNLSASQAISTYPVSPGFTPDFTRDITVYDSLGTEQALTLNFKHVESPGAIAVGTADLSGVTGPLNGQLGFTNTDTFDITVGATGPTTITLDGDMGKLLSDINAIVDVNGNQVAFASLDANGFLTIKGRNIADNVDLVDGSGGPLAGGLQLAPATYTPNATPPNLLAAPSDPNNTEGWWHVEFVTASGTVVSSGEINFDSNGQLNATPDGNGQVLNSITGIDWLNGSATQDIDFDLADLTQFSSTYNVISSSQNGSSLGQRTGISIDDDGYVTAQFSNGQSQRVYKLSLATFANANGLDPLTGNVFRESDTSGAFNLREAGTGGAGDIQGGALEQANVDLAEEFSKMIITQRAYSANTKVITTADQMTAELLQIR